MLKNAEGKARNLFDFSFFASPSAFILRGFENLEAIKMKSVRRPSVKRGVRVVESVEREAVGPRRDPKKVFAAEQFNTLREMGISDDDVQNIVKATKLSLAVPAVIFCRKVVQFWRKDWTGSEYALYRTIAETMKKARSINELEWLMGAYAIESVKQELFPGFVRGCLLILEMDLMLSLNVPEGFDGARPTAEA